MEENTSRAPPAKCERKHEVQLLALDLPESLGRPPKCQKIVANCQNVGATASSQNNNPKWWENISSLPRRKRKAFG